MGVRSPDLGSGLAGHRTDSPAPGQSMLSLDELRLAVLKACIPACNGTPFTLKEVSALLTGLHTWRPIRVDAKMAMPFGTPG